MNTAITKEELAQILDQALQEVTEHSEGAQLIHHVPSSQEDGTVPNEA